MVWMVWMVWMVLVVLWMVWMVWMVLVLPTDGVLLSVAFAGPRVCVPARHDGRGENARTPQACKAKGTALCRLLPVVAAAATTSRLCVFSNALVNVLLLSLLWQLKLLREGKDASKIQIPEDPIEVKMCVCFVCLFV